MASTSGMKKEEEQPQAPQERVFNVPGALQKRTDGVRTIDAETQRKVEGLDPGAVQPRFMSTDGNVLFSASGERLDSMLHRTGTYTNPNDLLPLYVGDDAAPAEGNKSGSESTPKPAAGKPAPSGAQQGPGDKNELGKEWPAGAAAIGQLAEGRPVGERSPFVTYRSTGGKTLQIPKGDTTGWTVIKDENGNETAVRTTGAGQPYAATQSTQGMPALPGATPGVYAQRPTAQVNSDTREIAGETPYSSVLTGMPSLAPSRLPDAGSQNYLNTPPSQWAMGGDGHSIPAMPGPGGMDVSRTPPSQWQMQAPRPAAQQAPAQDYMGTPPSQWQFDAPQPAGNAWSDPAVPGYDASTGMMAPAYVPSAIPLGPQAPQPQGLVPMPYGQPGNWREGAW